MDEKLMIHVRDGARIKYKLMGFMVYFQPVEKHLLLHDIFVHGKGQKRCLLLRVSLHIHEQRNHCDFSDVSLSAILAIRLAVSWNSSLQCAHD